MGTHTLASLSSSAWWQRCTGSSAAAHRRRHSSRRCSTAACSPSLSDTCAQARTGMKGRSQSAGRLQHWGCAARCRDALEHQSSSTPTQESQQLQHALLCTSSAHAIPSCEHPRDMSALSQQRGASATDCLFQPEHSLGRSCFKGVHDKGVLRGGPTARRRPSSACSRSRLRWRAARCPSSSATSATPGQATHTPVLHPARVCACTWQRGSGRRAGSFHKGHDGSMHEGPHP